MTDSHAHTQRRRTDGARILVVEDNHDLRLLMQLALEDAGYSVDGVASAEEGIRKLATERYSLVLSDYGLPGNTGVWLLSEAVNRDLLRGAATLLVTADPDAPGITADFDVVPKPVDFERFLPQIRAILADVHAAAESREGGRGAHLVELVLYVSSASAPSMRAARVAREVLSRYDSDAISFTICDVAVNPEECERDNVLFTPSLVKRYPLPRVWILGALAQPRLLADVLSSCGVPEIA